MTNLSIQTIESGQMYGCRFRVQTMLDENGRPAQGSPGDMFEGPGEYTGTGIIAQRDLDSELVRVKDFDTNKEFVVPFDQIWDIDYIELVD